MSSVVQLCIYVLSIRDKQPGIHAPCANGRAYTEACNEWHRLFDTMCHNAALQVQLGRNALTAAAKRTAGGECATHFRLARALRTEQALHDMIYEYMVAIDLMISMQVDMGEFDRRTRRMRHRLVKKFGKQIADGAAKRAKCIESAVVGNGGDCGADGVQRAPEPQPDASTTVAVRKQRTGQNNQAEGAVANTSSLSVVYAGGFCLIMQLMVH